MFEVVDHAKESMEKIIEGTKKSLSLLEKETWVDFLNRASNWLKDIFGFNDNKKEEGKLQASSVQSRQTEYDNPNYASQWGYGYIGSDNRGDKAKSMVQASKESDNNLTAYTNVHIDDEKVRDAWNYIANGGTFHSNSKGTISWGWGKYKHVCSTGSFNVLWKLGLPKVSNSTECDLQGKVLPKMGLEYIGEVDPDNPEKSGYKPQNGDTAVWPKFRNGSKTTQHQATFINGHWVSDTIQNRMSCYNSKNEPMVKVYRYTGKQVA